jgi:hypothetical protein
VFPKLAYYCDPRWSPVFVRGGIQTLTWAKSVSKVATELILRLIFGLAKWMILTLPNTSLGCWEHALNYQKQASRAYAPKVQIWYSGACALLPILFIPSILANSYFGAREHLTKLSFGAREYLLATTKAGPPTHDRSRCSQSPTLVIGSVRGTTIYVHTEHAPKVQIWHSGAYARNYQNWVINARSEQPKSVKKHTWVFG